MNRFTKYNSHTCQRQRTSSSRDQPLPSRIARTAPPVREGSTQRAHVSQAGATVRRGRAATAPPAHTQKSSAGCGSSFPFGKATDLPLRGTPSSSGGCGAREEYGFFFPSSGVLKMENVFGVTQQRRLWRACRRHTLYDVSLRHASKMRRERANSNNRFPICTRRSSRLSGVLGVAGGVLLLGLPFGGPIGTLRSEEDAGPGIRVASKRRGRVRGWTRPTVVSDAARML